MKRGDEQALRAAIEHEIALAASLKEGGNFHLAFYHLERAHVLGHTWTYQRLAVLQSS